jgi:CDP-glucose 4,6-dehydratase
MFWQGKRVFVTGHTGFKGGWLSLWLQQLGAHVMGYSLDPPSAPNLFDAANVGRGMDSVIGDICDLAAMRSAMLRHRPEIVIHMAAQSIVRVSYQDPIGTYQTNVIGSANLMEAVRSCDSVRACVIVTSDKCYENREWVWPYRENDRLGGHDPYSNSKACAELIVSAYRNSFFDPGRFAEHHVAIASSRAGNVIGGGDWAHDRLIADIIRAFSSGEMLTIRNPNATRPWQHVLEPVRGYLMLAQRLYESGPEFGSAYNFGPEYADVKPVEWIVSHMASAWGASAKWTVDRGAHPHEAQMLRLDWTKAFQELGWRPALSLAEALEMTLDWYRHFQLGRDVRQKSLDQIATYTTKSSFEKAAISENAVTQ